MSRLIQTVWGHMRKPDAKKSGTRQMSRPLRLECLEERCVLSGNASGIVSGVAFVDFNQNGARDPGEFVLPGVQTTLTGTTKQGVSVNVTTTTDANGIY